MLNEEETTQIKPTLALAHALCNLKRGDVLEFILLGALTEDCEFEMDLESVVYLTGLLAPLVPSSFSPKLFDRVARKLEVLAPGFTDATLQPWLYKNKVLLESSTASVELGIKLDREAADSAWADGKIEKGKYLQNIASAASKSIRDRISSFDRQQLNRLDRFFLDGYETSNRLGLTVR